MSAEGAMMFVQVSVLEDLTEEVRCLRQRLDRIENELRDRFGDTMTDIIINGDH